MSQEIAKQYDPAQAQRKWYATWESEGHFHSEPDRSRPPYCIVIPPPNVTGALHMGHALNDVLQDILIRWKRMQGCAALWVPGSDHAGIATQAVVERRLRDEEGKTRHDLGREKLVERIWAWKDDYEVRILRQLKRMGCSCDWQRTRFTLDEVCARAVRETFFNFFKEGLIYRGKRLVNWDTHLQTAVADDEVYHETVQGHLWTFRYPIQGSDEQILIATTRPETMLGDTAVAVHPDDERYRHLIGKTVLLPLVNREIPIVADGLLVKQEFGTGAVKVTPAHDPNDYQCAQRNDLPMINILNPDGTINENGGAYAGLDRYEARTKVVADLEALGLVEKIEPYETDIGHSDRSKTPIEPYLSDQWFVAMGELAQTAIDAVNDGRVEIFPPRYAKTYLDWLGEKRDWCISRQLWWGHRIPVWTFETASLSIHPNEVTEKFNEFLAAARITTEVHLQNVEDYLWRICAGSRRAEEALAALEEVCDRRIHDTRRKPDGSYRRGKSPEQIQRFPEAVRIAHEFNSLIAYIVQDPDVLDTWFSSALWPHSTLGWPEKTPELEYYYPTSVLVTSRDIITLWVARMVMTGLHNCSDVPFRNVYIHPKILDGQGQTMSKSKGNGVDPLDIIDKYGADALRFTLAHLTTEQQDVRMPVAYECPHCGGLLAQTAKHQELRAIEGKKPRLKCPSCKKDYQPSSPNFDADRGEPVGRLVSDRFEIGRNFANKLWNASRFALLNLEGYAPARVDPEGLALEDRWILSRLTDTAARVSEHLDAYRFSDSVRSLYEFTWSEFCDWYLEMIKPRLLDDAARPAAQRVLAGVLDVLLRLLHPVVPFVTEEIWSRLGEVAPARGLLEPADAAGRVIIAPWPVLPVQWRDEEVEVQVRQFQEIVTKVRNLRTELRVPPKATVELHLRCSEGDTARLLALGGYFERLAKANLKASAAGPNVSRPRGSASFTLADLEGHVPVADLINLEAEMGRQQKQLAQLERRIESSEQRLGDPGYLEKAPPEVVQQQRDRLDEDRRHRDAVKLLLEQLQGG